MTSNKIKTIALGLAATLALTGCDLDEKFYSEANPDTFYTSQESVYSVLRNPFRHWHYMYNQRVYWLLQEVTTDEMCCPARAADFYDNGDWVRLHEHTWSTEDGKVKNAYNQMNYIVSHALVSIDGLSGVDYAALGLTERDKADHLNQLNALVAYAYMRSLDLFGGLPIYTTPNDAPKARNTRKENFDYIERTLKSAIPNLHKRESLSEYQDGYLTMGAGAMLLAQLYLNAVPFIGEDRYADAEKILQDLYDGVYGVYELDPTWYGPHSFTNHESPEAMWYIPSETSKEEFKGCNTRMYPYNAKNYFDCGSLGKCYNGFQLAPSLEKEGVPYTTKMGRPFAKFHEKDLRKKPYVYNGDGNYEGMFLMGLLKNPHTGKVVKGTKLLNGKKIELVDYVNITGSKSDMLAGDENSGIRLVKMPVPNDKDVLLLYNPDFPVMRFTEVVYNLAECRFHRGDKDGAAALINSVRKRNFENGADPDPVTAANLDIYRLADEYMIEFIGEAHRRTDLIRWGLFTSEEWWDKQPTPDTRNVFCIPSEAIYANPLLEQNPGY